jgi:phage terminase large subunit-like protein
VITHPAGTASKQVRAADALDHYNRKRVEHAPGNREAEGQMVAFPKAPHDDLVDAVGAGVRYFLSREKKKGTGFGSTSVGYA